MILFESEILYEKEVEREQSSKPFNRPTSSILYVNAR